MEGGQTPPLTEKVRKKAAFFTEVFPKYIKIAILAGRDTKWYPWQMLNCGQRIFDLI